MCIKCALNVHKMCIQLVVMKLQKELQPGLLAAALVSERRGGHMTGGGGSMGSYSLESGSLCWKWVKTKCFIQTGFQLLLDGELQLWLRPLMRSTDDYKHRDTDIKEKPVMHNMQNTYILLKMCIICA